MSNVFFTSDEHYGHENIRTGWAGKKGEVAPRPFSSLKAMTDGLIDRNNEVVRKGDLVYHLGDMFWRTLSEYDVHDIMDRLNGTHYYILGNHEEQLDKHPSIRRRFLWVKERARISPFGAPKHGIVLDHFAGRVWDKSHQGSWQLYGHSHGYLPELHNLLSFDVGVDCNNFYPVSMDEVRGRMEHKGAI